MEKVPSKKQLQVHSLTWHCDFLFYFISDMLHESGQCSSSIYKISSGSMSLIKDPSLPVPVPSVLCCIKAPVVSGAHTGI